MLTVCLQTKLNAQTYCLPGFQMACFYGDKITRVRFAGIDHSDNVCNTDPDGKKDFTASIAAAQLTKGSSYTLTVTFEVNSSVGAYAWVDFNGDGIFATTEAFNLGTRTSAGDLSVVIPVPATAVSGTTRLRVMNRKNNVNAGPGPGDACHSISNYRGQMKDYSIVISGGSGLPVALTSFTAEPRDHQVLINWSTETERDNDFFTIQRSQNGWSWESYSTQKAVGNSTLASAYGFTDLSPYSGLSYYRLLQSDVNGTTVNLATVSVLGELPVGVYPNPFTDRIVVPQSAGSEMKLYDATGRLMNTLKTEFPDGTQILHTAELPAGAYRLVVSNRAVSSSLLIK